MNFAKIFLILFSGGPLYGQVNVAGYVTDGKNGRPLPGATVVCEGEKAGVTTDTAGRFLLSCAGDTLEVRYLGYLPRRLGAPRSDTTITVSLFPDTLRVFGDDPVVVSSRPLPVQLKTPAPLSRLHPPDLARDEALSIAPALNRIGGVLMQSGALNTNRITIRGVGNRSPFGTAKIRAYLDEIPLTNGTGETTIEDLDLSLLGGVDVWKGPTGSTYGAGLGGMLHLRTTPLRAAAPTFAQWQSTFGAYGRRRLVGQFHYRETQQLSWDLNVNHTRSDGYRENNDYDRLGVAAIGKWRASENHHTSLLLNYQELRAQIPSSLNRIDFENDPRQAAANWARVSGFEDNEKLLLGVTHRAALVNLGPARRIELAATPFVNYRTNYEVRPFNILRENSLALGLRGRIDYRRGPQTDLPILSLGAEAFREGYDWQTNAVTASGGLDTLLSDNRERRRYLSLFAEANLRWGDRWRLAAGLNWNTTGYSLTDRFPNDGKDLSGDFTYEPIWSPKLGLSYDLAENALLFAVLSYGFSIPTVEETLTPEGARNPDIRPETGWNIELGWRGKQLWEQLSFELTLYSMQIKDLLVARRTALDQFLGANAGRTVHNGLEAFLGWRPLRDADQIELWVSYTYADYFFADFVDGEQDFSGNELTGTAPHHLNAGVDFAAGPFYGNVNYRFLDALPANDGNTVYTQPFQLFNLRAGFRKTLAKRVELDLFAGINNLLDEPYAAMVQVNAAGFGGSLPRYFYPGLPRNAYAGLRVRYFLPSGE